MMTARSTAPLLLRNIGLVLWFMMAITWTSNSVVRVVTAQQDPAVVAARLQASNLLLQGGAEFDDPQSYQSAALARTAAVVGIETVPEAKLFQYYALYCIFNATNMVPNYVTDLDPRFEGLGYFPGWLIQTGWTDPNVDPCEGFHGVICDDQGRVSVLDLFENVLTGSFPPEVVYLSLDGPFAATGAGNLYRIDLFGNEFLHNNNDMSWLTDLGSNMTTFIAEGTKFGGDIPRLPDNLVNFNIADAQFTGGLEDSNFENLNLLNFIDMDGNQFNTTVPGVFSRLPSLEYFFCSDCFLQGDLSFLQGMESIVELWMDANPNITGRIPDFIGDLTTLQSLSIAYNSLTGYMPTTLGKLTAMKQFWAYSNHLRGEIPTALGQLTQMSILQLEGNAFVGSMPEDVCDNTKFPQELLDKLGADCDDILFLCPCCTCCDLATCLAQDVDQTRTRTRTRRRLRRSE